MNVNELVEIIEEAGYETRRYSGRGMDGRKCVGFIVESMGDYKAIAEIMFNYTDYNRTDLDFLETLEKLAEILGRAKTDAMGRDDIIMYFPTMKFEEDNEQRS